jgi:hypothetical protein
VAGQIVRAGISFRLDDLARKIFPVYSPDQYFSQEVGRNVKSGAGVKRMGELYGHEKKGSY